MSICAIICEYNPLHNGHLYHIERARELSGCQYVLCLMSGSVVQRATLAAADKYTRALVALEGGADIVMELPAIYASANAQLFASGAVRMLTQIPGVTHISFGVEDVEPESFQSILDAMCAPDYAQKLQKHLASGASYPAANSKTLSEYYDTQSTVPDIVLKPNNILALEYLRALKQWNSDITPVLVRRIGDYHSTRMDTQYPSASALRAAFERGEQGLADYMPAQMLAAMHSAPDPEIAGAILLCCIKNTSLQQLEQLYSVSEGIHHRLAKAAQTAGTLAQLIDSVKTRRYTHSRLRRIALQNYLHITHQAVRMALEAPQLYRVLGMRSDAAHLLGGFPKYTITKNQQLQSLPLGTQAILDICTRADHLFECAQKLERDLTFGHGVIVL